MSLILRDIRHHYGETEAVASASLEAAPGEILCLFGPSGCGKTTLLRLAAGLERVQAGSVELDGAVLSNPQTHTPAEQRPIGLVFQDYVLFPHLTVAQNVAFGLKGLSRKEQRARVEAELAAVDLSDYATRYPHMLSGGQQQRAAIARAFARQPKAMLLDEPFASIDAVRRRRLRDDVRSILKAHKAAAILVTHDPEEALALGDRIAIMKAGRVIETAAPQMLFEAPQTPEGAAIFPNAQMLSVRIQGNHLYTVFGDVASDIRHDGAATIVIHEGGAGVTSDDQGPAEVIDCRFVGPGWRALLKSTEGDETLLVASETPIELGRMVGVTFDPALCHVFPDA